ncbi:cytochrome c family protein [Candidatus Methylomicrobium oryzae]|jgi:mono/diheme cytochrome c family protein|uniref:cytochrome c family protein n=1 Tax=Candidatus Methylomicrobium oryzae TaxID=2802053 RepID=UPI00192509DE|nr:cytochrome c family protein [Methylomicrobium sp. RS1]MBL1263112.1 cytochrome c family protein [Methylomicrobium sp. RS1]
MAYHLKFILAVFLAITVFGKAGAVELPPPADLSRQSALPSRKVTVVEPHESTHERQKLVEYMALPVDGLLAHWFGGRRVSEEAEIVFLAKDGYRSVISGPQLKKYRAFLAFARSDGAPFTVDNSSQNERKIPLGPYYLIWDNREVPELLRQGAYGWPYQVTAVEWHSKSEDRALLPARTSSTLEQGFAETKGYCLTCHNIRGIGGKKYPVDLIRALCRWQEPDLKAWIDSPSRIKPGTAMPPLARLLPEAERQRMIGRIAGYLDAMKVESSEACARSAP